MKQTKVGFELCSPVTLYMPVLIILHNIELKKKKEREIENIGEIRKRKNGFKNVTKKKKKIRV